MVNSNPGRSAEILVAAITHEDLSLFSSMLTSYGYNVRSADSGEQVLALLQCQKPDLVLLDMDLMDIASQTYQQIRKNIVSADVPVIFLITPYKATEWADNFQAGGCDFILKPCQGEEMLLRVRNQLVTRHLNKELEDSKRHLFIAQETLRSTLMSIGDGVICTDEDCRVTMINDVARNTTGWYQDSAIGQPFHKVYRVINEQTREPVQDPLQKALETGRVIRPKYHSALISKDGIVRPIADRAVSIRDVTGKQVGTVLAFRDVTSEKLHMNEIEFLSCHDHLTELYNRRYLEAELNRLDKLDRLPLTLVIGDLNGLKMTNDAFGHFAGDDLLRKTAAILKKCFRQGDIISRFGGDEFVILLPNTTPHAAEAMIKKALEKVKESKSDKGILSISFGWFTKTSKSQSIDQVLKNAEDNMYKRKLLESPSIRSATINAIVKTLYEKNPREEAHSKRVSELSSAIGQALSLPESEINNIKTAGLLHDIGKIMIPTEILDKKTPLSNEEWTEIRRHPETAYRILCGVAEMTDLAESVRQHHERWDGKGYPLGLKGNEITLVARIICVADAFDAMTTRRPYRDGMTVQEAMEELHRQAGVQFDPDIVHVFLENVRL